MEGNHEPFGSIWPSEENDMDLEKQELIYELYMRYKSIDYIKDRIAEKFETGSDHRTINKEIEKNKWDEEREKMRKRAFNKILKKIENEKITSYDILNKMITMWLQAFSEERIDAPSNKIALEAIKIIHLLKDNPIEGSDRVEAIIKKSMKKE